METLRKASNAIGRRMVKVEGEREIGVGEAIELWAAHIAFIAYRTTLTGGSRLIGMDYRKPVVYGKEQQAPVENEASST